MEENYTEILKKLGFVINHLEQDLRLLRELSVHIVTLRMKEPSNPQIQFKDGYEKDDDLG